VVEEPLIYVKDLDLRFYTYEGIVEALDKVRVLINDGETLGVVGETGCGKSVTGLSELVIVPPPGKIEGGKIFVKKGDKWLDLLRQKESYLRRVRGKDIAMIFQDPKSALNPVYTVRQQIAEAIWHHRLTEICEKVLENDEKVRGRGILTDNEVATLKEMLKNPYLSSKIKKSCKKILDEHTKAVEEGILSQRERKLITELMKNPRSLRVKVASKIPFIRGFRKKLENEVTKEIIRILGDMRIPDPERVAEMYPHELSGGMAQRVVIAIALSCSPRLLIADEPTTNLDVTVQLQILNLIKELKEKYGTTVQYITHDMGVIAEMCDRVAVMYAGNVVELAGVLEIFRNPLHPYTKALLECIPRPGCAFKSIEGTVPSLIDPPKGCRFNDRCPYAMEICASKKPDFVKVKEGHYVLCHLYSGGSS
jgi:peptide/nickel transport system ATP-binding protein